MKRVVLSVLVLAGAAATLAMTGARPHHRIVIDAASGEETWESVLNNVENTLKEFSGEPTEIEVVVHGQGLGLLVEGSPHAGRVGRLANEGAVFVACANTMRRRKIGPEALLPAVGVVPSGVAEIVRKQEAGWSYVKAGS